MATPGEELSSLRRRLATSRRQLRDVREAQAAIVDTDDEALDLLSAREASLTAHVAEMEGLLAQAQEVLSLRARAQGMLSSPFREEVETLRRSVYLSITPGDAPTPSANAPISPAPPATMSAEGAARRGDFNIFSPDSARTGEDSPEGGGQTEEQEQLEPVRAPKLSSINLPVLRDPMELAAHISDVEKLLLESGIGRSDPAGAYLPPNGATFSVCMKIAQTLGEEKMRRTAEDLIRLRDDWPRVKRELKDRFLSAIHMADEFQRRLSSLRWHGTADCTSFVDDIRRLWRLIRHSPNSIVLRRDIVIAVLGLLPTNILSRVLEGVNAAETPNWELGVDLEADGAHSFCAEILRAARVTELINRARQHPASAPTGTHPGKPSEKVKAVVPSIKAVNYHRMLVAKFPKGIPIDQEKTVLDLLEPYPYKPYTSKRGNKGVLVACDNDSQFEELRQRLLATGTVTCHDFVEREYASSKAPPRTMRREEDDRILTRDKCSRVCGSQMEYFVRGHVESRSPAGLRLSLEPMPLLEIDSGAGLNYIIPGPELEKKLENQLIDVEECFGVGMANGAQDIVSKKLITTVTLYTAGAECLPVATRDIELHVLRNQGSEGTQILLGRDSIARFDLVISKHGVSTEGGYTLMDVGPKQSVLLNDTSRFVSADKSSAISAALSRICDRAWVPLLRSDGYRLRLRTLDPHDPRDHPDQTHTFEVSVPTELPLQDRSDAVVAKAEKEARGMLRRMDNSRRMKQGELVGAYVKQGWWQPASVDECRARSRFTPVMVFMVGGGAGCSRKPRLVVNFKPVNEKLPTSSTPSTAPAHLLAAFRHTNPECVVISDAASAFYKIRLHRDFLWLVVCVEEDGVLRIRHFLSDRVVFGVVFGPSSLITSMAELFQDKGSLTPLLKAFCGWYMDDNIIAGSVDQVCDSLSATIALLRRTGHDLQLSKCAAICTPAVRNEFTARLSVIGEIMIADTAQVLGVQVDYDESGSLRIRCNPEGRLAALQQIAIPVEHATDARFTKAEYFSIAGALSYDVVREHPAEKFVADAIRSLIGREFAAEGWHTKLSLGEMEPLKQNCWRIIVSWANELKTSRECCHISGRTAGRTLTLYTDASSVGGGFCIRSGETQIWSDCWRWTGSATRWHINFQELHAVYRALRALADIVECIVRFTPPGHSGIRICIYSDNRSAVRWSTVDSGEILSKHQSRRTLTRLIDQIGDEWKVLKRHAKITIEHLPGAMNTRADELSRYGFRKLNDQDTGSLQDMLEIRKKPEKKICEGTTVLEAIDSDVVHDDSCDAPDATDEDWMKRAFAEEPWKWDDGRSAAFADQDQSEDPQGGPAVTGRYTSQSVLRCVDTVLALRSPATQEHVGWAEHAAAESYDVDQLRDTVKHMRVILRAWYAQRKGEGRREVLDSTPDSFEICLARSAQDGMSIDRLPKAMRNEVGPMTKSNEVWMYRAPLPTGEYVSWPFIPHSKSHLQSLFIRDAHRACGHMGLDYTLSRISGVVLHNPRSVAKTILQQCLFCQRKHASRGFKQGFESVHDRVGHGPYEAMAIDHLSLGEAIDVLVVLCLATGHVTVSACEDMTAASTARSFRRVLYRFGAKPRYLLADKAVNISAAVDELRREFGDFDFNQTTARSQFENGRLERLNGILLPLATAKLHFNAIKLPTLDPLSLQDLCDYLSYQLNQRPVGKFVDDPDATDLPVVLTPNVIVFGSCGSPLEGKTSPFLNAWKKVFDECHWKELKRRSDLAVRGSTHPFRIKERVLYFKPSTKLALAWHFAQVIDIRGRRLLLRDINGKEFLMHEFNVCPLSPVDQNSATDVTRVGAKVVVNVDDVDYFGTVTEERSGCLLVSFDQKGDRTWPPEWYEAVELRFNSGQV